MNSSHVRKLSIVIRALEEAIVELESSLGSSPQASERVLTEYNDDIPESMKPAIEARLREIRHEITNLSNCYGLNTDKVSNRRRLSTKLLILAIDLAECQPRYLRSYGELPDDEAAALAERMSRLEAIVYSLVRLLESHE